VSGIKSYLAEVWDELINKVTWPTWQELQTLTIQVVGATFILALMVFIMDYFVGISDNPKALWSGLMGFVYNFFIL